MKSPISLSAFLLLALTGLAAAGVPTKPSASKYNSLVTKSPFTSKSVIKPEQEINVFDDYSLLGVSPIGGSGYRVTLINKKQPDERITVDSGSPNSDFKIIEVTHKSGDPLGTLVRMSHGSKIGTVGFDQKLLAITSKAAPPQSSVRRAISGIEITGRPGTAALPKPSNIPRPRVVAPTQ